MVIVFIPLWFILYLFIVLPIMLAAQAIQDASTSGLNAVTDEVVVKSEQTWGKAMEAAKAVAGV